MSTTNPEFDPALGAGLRDAYEQLARHILGIPDPKEVSVPVPNPFAEKEFLGFSHDGSAAFVGEDWYPQSYVDNLLPEFPYVEENLNTWNHEQLIHELTRQRGRAYLAEQSVARHRAALEGVQQFIDGIHDLWSDGHVDSLKGEWDHLQQAFDDGLLTNPLEQETTFTFEVTVKRTVEVTVKHPASIDEDEVKRAVWTALEEAQDIDAVEDIDIDIAGVDIEDIDADNASYEVDEV